MYYTVLAQPMPIYVVRMTCKKFADFFFLTCAFSNAMKEINFSCPIEFPFFTLLTLSLLTFYILSFYPFWVCLKTFICLDGTVFPRCPDQIHILTHFKTSWTDSTLSCLRVTALVVGLLVEELFLRLSLSSCLLRIGENHFLKFFNEYQI